jgi:hypothetical protein
MKIASLLLLSFVLSSCVDPMMMPPPGGPGAPPPSDPSYPGGYPNNPDSYHDHYDDPSTTEYRNGYDIGRKDARYGMPRDPHRAYSRFGRGRQTFFMEGYDHGYYGRRMVH